MNTVRVLVLPRADNPYQELLHAGLRRRGAQITYLQGPTGSQTLNLLLLPGQLLAFRLRGTQILHLHWVYGFALPPAAYLPALRRAAQWWFIAVLWLARRLGYRIVWTAHNVLPHERTFHDEVAARRALVRYSDAVIVHTPATLTALAALGLRPHRSAHIRHGSYQGAYPQTVSRAQARRDLALAPHDTVLLFVGNIVPYKGVDLLLQAFAEVLAGGAPQLRLVVAGHCRDAAYAAELTALASAAGPAVRLDLGFVPDERLQVYLRAATVGVFPFREVTTSGSVLLALSFGLPVLIPAVPALADLPDQACLRYPPTPAGLRSALTGLTAVDTQRWDRLAAGAQDYVRQHDWDHLSAQTAAVYEQVL